MTKTQARELLKANSLIQQGRRKLEEVAIQLDGSTQHALVLLSCSIHAEMFAYYDLFRETKKVLKKPPQRSKGART